MSGRRTVLLLLFAIPLVVIPLLLAGKAYEREVCLRTLEQRERERFVLGSFPVHSSDWRPVDAWPSLSPRFPGAFPPRASTPAAYSAAFAGQPGHAWVNIERVMPFAFVVPITNPHPLTPGKRDLVDAKRLAAHALDPENQTDRQAWKVIDELLLEGVVVPIPGERQRPRRFIELAEGEKRAARLLEELDRARAQDDPREAMRKTFRDFVPSN